MCPNNPEIFDKRWSEIGGLFDYSHRKYLPLVGKDWPSYLPMIRPGIRRTKPLNSTFVALSLHEVLRCLKTKKGGFESPGRSLFRRKLCLREDCKVALIGVGPDHLVESFYAHYREYHYAEIFADLDIIAVTPPNFSFFLDVPRTQSLYNRKRMLRVADEFLDHGVPVAPHFNASNKADWEFWIDLLQGSPDLSMFCKEFQTGNKLKLNYDETVNYMVRMQHRVGRSLHPLLVAGKKPLRGLKPHFKTFTVIDSEPSMRTNHRQILSNGKWQTIHSSPKACLSKLLDHNIAAYARILERKFKDAANQKRGPEQPVQPEMAELELEDYISRTNLSPLE